MAGTRKLNSFAYWGGDDVTFDLGLDKFGVDLRKLGIPVDPKLKFVFLIKGWEFPLVKYKMTVLLIHIFWRSTKLFFVDTSVAYTIYGEKLDFKKGINGCWYVLAMPPIFDGGENSLLESLLINNYILVDFIKEMDQPEANNSNLVLKITGGDG